MTTNHAASVLLECPRCHQRFMAIAGSVKQCVGCKVALVPVKREEAK